MPDDIYIKFLGLPPGPRPPKAYQLLGIASTEHDPAVIEAAAAKQMDKLDQFALSGDRTTREQVQQLMNEVAKARVKMTRGPDARAKTKPQPTPQPINEPVAPKPAAVSASKVTQAQPAPRRRAAPTRKARPGASSRPSADNKRPKRSAEFWAILGTAWLMSVMLTGVTAYLIAQGSRPGTTQLADAGPKPVAGADAPSQPTDLGTEDLNRPVDQEPADPEAIKPPTPPDPEVDKPTQPDVTTPKPVRPPSPSDAVQTWQQVQQIDDPDARLAAFIKLRDSMEPYSKEQAELIRQALIAFNDAQDIKMLVRNLDDGSKTLHLRGNGFVYPDQPHATDAITDISVFTGMAFDTFDLSGMKMIEDFSVLGTMRIKRLRLEGCRKFSDAAVLNEIEGIEDIDIGATAVSDLRPLKLNRLRYLSIKVCRHLESLAGLEGMTIESIWASSSRSLKDISALRQVKGLTKLDLGSTAVTDLTSLEGHKLTYLDLRYCRQLTSLKGLETMTSLETLVAGSSGASPAEIARVKQAQERHQSAGHVGQASTFEEVMRIQNRDARLAAFIKLRDSMKPRSKEQRDLLEEALERFNNVEDVDVRFVHGSIDVDITGGQSPKDNDNGKLFDLSPFTGMQSRRFNMGGLKKVKDFRFLTTMKLESVSVSWCDEFSDITLFNKIEGLNSISASGTAITSLRGLTIDEFSFFAVTHCKKLRTVDGLQGKTIHTLRLDRCEGLTDISAIEQVKGLKTLYLHYTNLPARQIERVIAAHPDADING